VATRQIAQTRQVAGHVRLRQLSLDGVQLVLENVQRLVEGAHETREALEGLSLRSAALRLLGVTALEALDAAPGVDELLLAREKGVALVAQFDPQDRLGGLGGKGVTARAGDGRFAVFGVDI